MEYNFGPLVLSSLGVVSPRMNMGVSMVELGVIIFPTPFKPVDPGVSPQLVRGRASSETLDPPGFLRTFLV